jgi:hydrogenase maturation protease
MKTLVLGIGNDLLADEGIGVHAVRGLLEETGGLDDVAFVDGGTLSFTLAGPIADADALIVIDAAQLDAEPGSVRLFAGAEMDHFLQHGKRRSVHEVGLLDLLTIARLTDSLPAQRALIGVQPSRVDWGDTPTEPVARALPRVRELTLTLIKEWNHGAR